MQHGNIVHNVKITGCGVRQVLGAAGDQSVKSGTGAEWYSVSDDFEK